MTSKDQIRFDRNANTIDFAAHCGKIIHYLAADIRPCVASGIRLEEYRDTCRHLINILDEQQSNVLHFLSTTFPRISLKPVERLILLLVAASRLQENVCRAQSLGSTEGHQQAEETREVLCMVLNQVRDEHYDAIVPIAITYWLQMNKGVYEGPPHAPQPEDH